MNNTLLLWLFGILGVLWIAVVFKMNVPNTQHNIVSVNMQAVISVPAHLVAKSMTKTQQQAFITRYSQQLDKTIKAYGQQHHVTVIAARTLYNAGTDVTAQIIQANLHRLRGAHA